MGISSPEGFLEMKAQEKAAVSEAKKENDLQRMAQLLPDSYFENIKEVDLITNDTHCEELVIGEIKHYFNRVIMNNTIPTTNGLASALNITRRQLRELSNKNTKIGIAVRKGYQAIASFAEEGLLSGKPPQGLVFWLKNNDDWVDAHEVKNSNKTFGEMLDEMKAKGEIVDGDLIEE